MGMMQGLKDSFGKMGEFTSKPFKWIDSAQTDRQRRIRLAVVCSGMIALGAILLTLSLSLAHVIPHGGVPTLDMKTAPLMFIGVALIAGGVGFAINQSIQKMDPEKQQKIVNITRVIGLVCFAVATGAMLFLTFHGGFAAAAMHSTQPIVAAVMTTFFILYVDDTVKNWKSSSDLSAREFTVYPSRNKPHMFTLTNLDQESYVQEQNLKLINQ